MENIFGSYSYMWTIADRSVRQSVEQYVVGVIENYWILTTASTISNTAIRKKTIRDPNVYPSIYPTIIGLTIYNLLERVFSSVEWIRVSVGFWMGILPIHRLTFGNSVWRSMTKLYKFWHMFSICISAGFCISIVFKNVCTGILLLP